MNSYLHERPEGHNAQSALCIASPPAARVNQTFNPVAAAHRPTFSQPSRRSLPLSISNRTRPPTMTARGKTGRLNGNDGRNPHLARRTVARAAVVHVRRRQSQSRRPCHHNTRAHTPAHGRPLRRHRNLSQTLLAPPAPPTPYRSSDIAPTCLARLPTGRGHAPS